MSVPDLLESGLGLIGAGAFGLVDTFSSGEVDTFALAFFDE